MKRTQQLYQKAKRLIPGGTQLLSKRPEQFLPHHWPAYYERAKGVDIWTCDEEHYIDMSYVGIGSTVLGYADPDVDKAVMKAIQNGSMTTLNCPEEVELAELLLSLHPWAHMVRYARCGGEAMAVAARIARAATGKDKIAICGYHGWHDWYLAANLSDASDPLKEHLLPGLSPKGVPKGLAETIIPFRYNQIIDLEQIIKQHGTQLAAVIMEPVRGYEPTNNFLQNCQELSHSCGAVWILDEVTSAWRMNTGGIHLHYNIEPDMAVFAKGMSNGYPMATIIGRSDVMQAAQESFISSTYWTERIGPTAALAMIRKHQHLNVGKHLTKIGNAVQKGWVDAAQSADLPIRISGIPPLSHFDFLLPEAAQVARTYFTQEMLVKGYLANNSFYATLAHGLDEHIAPYTAACEYVFHNIKNLYEKGILGKALNGPVAHKGFQRLTEEV